MVCQEEPHSLPFPAFLWVLSDPIFPVRSFSFPQRDFFGESQVTFDHVGDAGKKEKNCCEGWAGVFFFCGGASKIRHT